MQEAEEEQQRLKALRGYDLLDTLPEPAFDALVQDAAARFRAPIALMSLVDEDRQWFKASVGLDATETPRSMSFCAHAICGDGIFIVPDALADARFSGNPLVTGNPKIRFYAGALIETCEGHRLGTVCVIDRIPRAEISADEREILKTLATKAMTLIEARKNSKTF